MGESKKTIYDSISYIENRLSDELNINKLAEQAFFSKAHYQRLFQDAIGEPAMEYIRKRRLRRAGIMLCDSDASILDIALQFGYATHEGFSRAFKEYFGMPPMQYRKRYSAINLIKNKEAFIMIPNEARKNISSYADDVAKDWGALSVELDKWIKPAEHEIEKDERTTGGIKVAFSEWSNFTGRIDSAKNEVRKLFSETTDVYELYDKADSLMKMLDDIIFQMHLLRFLTGIEKSRMGQHGVPFEPILEGIAAVCENEFKRKDSAIKLITAINNLIQMEIKREALECIQKAAEEMREAVKDGAALTEELNSLVIKLGAYGRGFAIIEKETDKAASCVRSAEHIVMQAIEGFSTKGAAGFTAEVDGSINKAIIQLLDAAFTMNVNAFNATVETARAGEENIGGGYADGVRNYAHKLQRTAKTCESLYKDFIKTVSLLSDGSGQKGENYSKLYSDVVFTAGFLTTQLCLEAERSGREDFRLLSQDFQKGLDEIKSDKNADKA